MAEADSDDVVERLRELLHAIAYGTDHVKPSGDAWTHLKAKAALELVTHLRSALRQARADTLEEAAKVAEDDYPDVIHAACHHVLPDIQKNISKRIRALSSRTPARADAWQTIETAPKDGTWFMIWRAGEDAKSCEIGCYDPHYWDKYVEAGDGLYRKVPIQISEWRGFNNLHRATHWMPLPSPPAPEVAP